MRVTAIAGTAARFAYGCYAWGVLIAVVLPLAAVLAVTPGLARRRRAARAAARLFFWLIGSPVRVAGHMPDQGACIVVANHSSYLDGLILTAALPPAFTFLIKHEMAFMPLAGFILKRLGSRFVDRANARHRHQTARQLVSSALNGDALALFPEGTFDKAEGLKPFQAGAFGAAWRARVPVVPAVVSGARRKLPSGAALPAPGPLSVTICAPLPAEDHETARDLLLATRAAMLEHLAEPDLGERSRRRQDAAAGDAPPPAEPDTDGGYIAE